MSTQDTSGAAGPTRLPPYLLTGGRVRPVDESLELEAQLVTTDIGRDALSQLSYERYDIVVLCGQQSCAVAEVAARLGLHLGVTRILVGDLIVSGHLSVRRPERDPRRQAAIIERVIRGLDAIT